MGDEKVIDMPVNGEAGPRESLGQDDLHSRSLRYPLLSSFMCLGPVLTWFLQECRAWALMISAEGLGKTLTSMFFIMPRGLTHRASLA